MNTWKTNPTSIVLIGRVNVGKSTLFNKLTEKTKAIISRVPGTTRDANQGLVSWSGHEFTIVDTGGWSDESDNEIIKMVSKESLKWALNASLVILVLDAKEGILPEDKTLARILQKKCKRLQVIINKVDTGKHINTKSDGFALGLGEPLLVSATHGRGLGDLLDIIVDTVPMKKSKKVDVIRVGLIGKPNVGKSSTINALAGDVVQMVSETPHTTREPHPVFLHAFGENWLLVDTAGIRKRSKQGDPLEKKGTRASLHETYTTDVNWLLIEINKPLSTQDKLLAEELKPTHNGLIIVANKWDNVEDKTTNMQRDIEKRLRANFRALKWAPIMFTSATNRTGYKRLLELTKKLYETQNSHLDEKKLQIWFQDFIKRHPATRPNNSNKKMKFLGFKQIDTYPITFQISVAMKDYLPDALINKMENEIRDMYDLQGLPIMMSLKRIRL